MTYRDLFEEMKLTPEERERLGQILTEQTISQMKSNSHDRETGVKSSEVTHQNNQIFDAKITQLLGAERFRQYGAYNEQIPDRFKVNMFTDSLVSTRNPIQPEQKKQMLNLILDEREKFNRELQSRGVSISEHTATNPEFYQRVGNRWASVLSPDQLNEYNKWQESMSEVSKSLTAKP